MFNILPFTYLFNCFIKCSMPFMMQKAGNSLEHQSYNFEATVPSTADKNLFFLLGSLRVVKIKLISFCNML